MGGSGTRLHTVTHRLYTSTLYTTVTPLLDIDNPIDTTSIRLYNKYCIDALIAQLVRAVDS